MSDIRNITLTFSCHEKLERNATSELYCHKCAHTIIDFRCQSAEALQEAMRQAGTKSVCGIFKRSQLSEKFAKYAAAATIAVTAASTTMCATETDKATKTPATPEPAPQMEVIPESPFVGGGATDPATLMVETIEYVTMGPPMAEPSFADTATLSDYPGFQEEATQELDQDTL